MNQFLITKIICRDWKTKAAPNMWMKGFLNTCNKNEMVIKSLKMENMVIH